MKTGYGGQFSPIIEDGAPVGRENSTILRIGIGER